MRWPRNRSVSAPTVGGHICCAKARSDPANLARLKSAVGRRVSENRRCASPRTQASRTPLRGSLRRLQSSVVLGEAASQRTRPPPDAHGAQRPTVRPAQQSTTVASGAAMPRRRRRTAPPGDPASGDGEHAGVGGPGRRAGRRPGRARRRARRRRPRTRPGSRRRLPGARAGARRARAAARGRSPGARRTRSPPRTAPGRPGSPTAGGAPPPGRPGATPLGPRSASHPRAQPRSQPAARAASGEGEPRCSACRAAPPGAAPRARQRPDPAQVAGLAAQLSMKLLSCLLRDGWRSLRSAFASIWRMRSRVTSKS